VRMRPKKRFSTRMRFCVLLLLLFTFEYSHASEFCLSLRLKATAYSDSSDSLSCETNSDCNFSSSQLLSCGCPNLLVGKGMETVLAFDKVYGELCGFDCISECKITKKTAICKNNLCVESHK